MGVLSTMPRPILRTSAYSEVGVRAWPLLWCWPFAKGRRGTYAHRAADFAAPEFDPCPLDIERHADLERDSTRVSFPVIRAQDAYDGADVTPVQVSGQLSDSLFSIGRTEQEYTATDAAGNVARCSFVVHVLGESLAAPHRRWLAGRVAHAWRNIVVPS